MKSHRVLNEGRGSKKPAFVLAVAKIDETLGSRYSLRTKFARAVTENDESGEFARSYEVVYWNRKDNVEEVVATGESARVAVDRAIAKVRS